MKRYLFFGLLIVIALGIGLWLGSQPDEPSVYELERSSIDLDFARSMLPFRIAFRVLLGLVCLAILAGVGWGAIHWLNRRADTLYPDRSGLYPIREGRMGGAKVFHDPNRTVSGATVYATGEPQLSVQHPMPDGEIYIQQQITAQAQAAQALRAAVSGISPFPSAERIPIDVGSRSRVSRPLPDIHSLDIEPSHIERLLLEENADEQ